MVEAADRVLDCQGQACPLPIVNTAREMKKELETGQVLEILATDPGVEPDMNAWTKRTGNELLGIEVDGDVFHVFVRKAG
jgi:tRNA 2-thiouridine synthesizing protein A